MSHRTFKINGTLFDIFDSQAGADRFIKANSEGDISVIVRRQMLTMRRNGFEMSCNTAGVVSNAREAGVLSAGQALLDEVEAMIRLEMAEDDKHPTDFPTISFKSGATPIDG